MSCSSLREFGCLGCGRFWKAKGARKCRFCGDRDIAEILCSQSEPKLDPNNPDHQAAMEAEEDSWNG